MYRRNINYIVKIIAKIQGGIMKKWIVPLIGIVTIVCIVCYIWIQRRNIPLDNTKFTVNTDAIEVYDKIFLRDKVTMLEGVIIDNTILDTSSIGEHTVEFFYKDKRNRKRKGSFSYIVEDTTVPIILLSNAYSLYVGDDKNLTEVILSADNYDKNPKREIMGDYDINQTGSYPLIYQVTDQSGNIATVDFTLYVREKPSNTGSSTNTTSYTDFNEVIKNYKTEKTKIGIDVSKWQGDIDFDVLKKAGVEFVIIRVGTGLGFGKESAEDIYFKQNIENATKAGIPVGIYYYSYATTKEEALKQAKWVTNLLKDYKITLPVAFDWESWGYFNTLHMSIYDINEVADTFLKTVEEAGYSSILYGSKYYLQNIWTSEEPVWLAHYTTNSNYEKEYKLWQLCDDGKVAGINGAVDIDILYE